jgi:tripartite-type tricarboxylate transporter receptor subunit TctC
MKKGGRKMLQRVRSKLQGAIAGSIGLAVLTAAISLPASAQEYPSKTIRIVVNSSAGATVDFLGRVFAQKLQERTGQSVVIENKVGAAGAIGADNVVKSDPDGYTLLVSGSPAIVTMPLVNPKISYSPKDLAPVALFGSSPTVLLVRKGLPANSIKDLVAMAKAKPKTLTYGSGGLASTGDMATRQFTLMTGIDLIHVPYNGSAPALNAILGSQVDMLYDTVRANLVELVKDGKLRALGVVADTRVAALPDVPTMAEAGVENIQSAFWVALFAPAKTPRKVIDYLNKQAIEIFNMPDVRAQLEREYLVLRTGSPDDVKKLEDEQIAHWGDIVRRINLKISN